MFIEQTRQDVLKYTLIAVLIYIVNKVLFGTLGLVLIFLPVPFCLIWREYSWKEWGVSLLAFVLMVILFDSAINALFLVFLISIFSVGIGQMIKDGYRFSTILAVTTFGFFLFVFIFYLAVKYIQNWNILEEFSKQWKMLVSQNFATQPQKFQDGLLQLGEQAKNLMPSIVAVYGLIASFFNLYIPRNLEQKKGKTVEGKSYEFLSWSRGQLLMAIAITVVALIVYALKWPYGWLIFYNWFCFISFAFMLTGFFYQIYILKNRLPKGIHFLIFFLTLYLGISFIYTILGIIDSAFNLKKED